MSANAPAMARLRFRTETGSVCELRRDALGMRWRRVSATLASGVLRSEEGRLLAWPVVEVGRRCALWSEPIVPPWPRLVLTSEVVGLLVAESPPPTATEPTMARAARADPEHPRRP